MSLPFLKGLGLTIDSGDMSFENKTQITNFHKFFKYMAALKHLKSLELNFGSFLNTGDSVFLLENILSYVDYSALLASKFQQD